MYELKLIMGRGMLYSGGDEEVRIYLKQLEDYLTELKMPWLLRGIIDDTLLIDIKRVVEQEIGYCKFYFEYLKKQKQPHFNEWVLLEGMGWRRSNGRTRAEILTDKSGLMVKLSLELHNDSETLRFLNSDYQKELIAYKHVKSVTTIAKTIEEYKALAEEGMKRREYPRWCDGKEALRKLDRLLHIVDREEG